MTEIVIAAAARTPIGSFNGASAPLPAHDLGKIAIAEAMRRANVAPGEVSEVIMGQILTAGEGRTRRARPPSPPASLRSDGLSASTRSAARACAPWRSAIRRCSAATARSSSPAARRA